MTKPVLNTHALVILLGLMVTTSGCTTVGTGQTTVTVTGVPYVRPEVPRFELVDASVLGIWYIKTGPEGLVAEAATGTANLVRSFCGSVLSISRGVGRWAFGSFLPAPGTVTLTAEQFEALQNPKVKDVEPK